jgi:putative flippase GtrA
MSESVLADEAPCGRVERLRGRVHPHHPSRQFVRYVTAGLLNTTLSFGVYRALLEIGTPYVLAAPLAFAVGSVNGYIINRRWTFAAVDTTRARIMYVLVQATGAAATSGLVLLFVREAGVGRIWAYLAAIPPVTVATFTANRFWTFSERSR